MPKYGEANTATGQAFRVAAVHTVATALELPIVSAADIIKLNHPINNSDVSGKQKGAMVLVKGSAATQWYVAMATGSAPADVWKYATLEADVIPVQ